jgi:uncharacterized protein
MHAIGIETPILIFAKAPEPGYTKTRLIPTLGAERAAALQCMLIAHALDTALGADIGPVELWCAPAAQHPALAQYAGRRGITLRSQCGGDLGMRMLHATRSALKFHPRTIIIGTDSPALTAADLRSAAQALDQRHDAVLIPAEDGGYVLIGLNRCDELLFDGLAWGGNQVMAMTRNRLATLAWRWQELRTLWDVDRPADYRRLLASGLLPELTHAQR